MKKFLATTLASLMVLSLAACGAKTEPAADPSAPAAAFAPDKSVTWICTSSAGGGSDIFTRKIGEIMTNENLVNGQTIVVSNETDGSGEVGRNKVATMTNDADTTLLTFNSGDLTPMVTNTKNRAANFRILAIMAVDKQLMFSCPTSDSKTDYAKNGGDQTDFAAAIEAAKNGTFVVVGGSKGDDIATFNKLLAEIGLTEQQMGYITYDSTSDAITAALGGNVDFVISKPAAAAQYVESGDLTGVLALANERYTGKLADAPTLSEIGAYENVEVPVWRGVAAPAAMSDAAAAYWSDVLTSVSGTEAWKTEYLQTYQLLDMHMNTTDATAYVTDYEATFMTENGLS
ncbi:MAG: tripartite tricarboxylate transporter substrate-binding protein [Oscillibacter sp.]